MGKKEKYFTKEEEKSLFRMLKSNGEEDKVLAMHLLATDVKRLKNSTRRLYETVSNSRVSNDDSKILDDKYRLTRLKKKIARLTNKKTKKKK